MLNKIMCCCGNGLGSSLIMKMTVEQALADMNMPQVEVVSGPLSDVRSDMADIFMVCSDLAAFMVGIDNVVLVDNIMSADHIKQRIEEFVREKNGDRIS